MPRYEKIECLSNTLPRAEQALLFQCCATNYLTLSHKRFQDNRIYQCGVFVGGQFQLNKAGINFGVRYSNIGLNPRMRDHGRWSSVLVNLLDNLAL